MGWRVAIASSSSPTPIPPRQIWDTSQTNLLSSTTAPWSPTPSTGAPQPPIRATKHCWCLTRPCSPSTSPLKSIGSGKALSSESPSGFNANRSGNATAAAVGCRGGKRGTRKRMVGLLSVGTVGYRGGLAARTRVRDPEKRLPAVAGESVRELLAV